MATVRVTEIKTVKVQQCPPENPFQLRWINIHGGWDTWVFSKRQEVSADIKDGEFFQRVVDYLEQANTFAEVIGKEAFQIVKLGYEGLDRHDVVGISNVLASPRVEYITGTPNTSSFKRIVVAVKPGTYRLYDTGEMKNGLEFQIVVPETILQGN